MAKINKTELERWRDLSASAVLSQIADYAKQDITFVPIKNNKTSRWNVTIPGKGDYEILATGPKFWDMRENIGGGGAVDLVMHLFGMDFKQAFTKLRKTMSGEEIDG